MIRNLLNVLSNARIRPTVSTLSLRYDVLLSRVCVVLHRAFLDKLLTVPSIMSGRIFGCLSFAAMSDSN